jgi:hypothetical protein
VRQWLGVDLFTAKEICEVKKCSTLNELVMFDLYNSIAISPAEGNELVNHSHIP